VIASLVCALPNRTGGLLLSLFRSVPFFA
jgi:hypothetical protein